MTETLHVWTDGSGTLIDGPACIGVVVFLDATLVCEASAYVGEGTNNLAELRAIRRGLWIAAELGGYSMPIILYSDSEYAIGSVTREWRPKVHEDLIFALRKQVAAFDALRFVHVEGHAGIFGNELADWLAGEARRRHLAAQGIVKRPKRRPGEEKLTDKVKRLTPEDWAEIRKACECPPDAKRGERCTKAAKGWIRCNAALHVWQDLIAQRSAGAA